MPNWKQFVCERLPRLELNAARETEIIEELAQLLEDRYTSARDEGCDEAAAMARASAKFPSGEQLAQQILAAERPVIARVPTPLHAEEIDARLRKTRRGSMLQDFLQDIRGALRLLQKNPGFTIVAVVTLALGIGANTAIFSLVNSALFQSLPFPEADEIVRLYTTNVAQGFNRINVSYPDLQDYAAHSDQLAGIAGYAPAGVNFTGDGEAERLEAARVTGSFFDLLRLKPLQGRAITAADEQSGERVAVITDRLWRRRFAGASVTGRRVILNGQEHALLGVVPHISGLPEMWVPLEPAGSTLRRNNRFLTALGRMKPGGRVEALRTELAGIAKNLQAAYPDTNKNNGIRVETLKAVLVDKEDRTIFAVLLGFVTLVLAIACANIANLMLSRSVLREREIAVRATLGATPRRLLRQLLTESLVLASVGGVLGIAAGYAGLQLLIGVLPERVPRLDEMRMDGWSIAYAAGLTLVTGVLFGLAPALQLARSSLLDSLKQGGHGSTMGGRPGRLREALVTGQVAAALALLICAGLFGKTFYSILQVRPGFDAENVLTFRLTLAGERYNGDERIAQAYTEIAERLRAVPGVEQAAYTSRLPMGAGSLWRGYMRDGDAPPPPDETRMALYWAVSPDYLSALRIPLVAGRAFQPRDEAAQPRIALINQVLAKQLWPGENAVGKRIRIHTDEDFSREIIGVMGNLRHNLEEPPQPQVFVPHRQTAWSTMTMVLRTAGDPYLLQRSVRDTLRAYDANLPVYQVRSMADRVAEQRASERSLALVLSSLGVAALALAAIGIYGVVSYSVRQRTQEIGVRIALGAQPAQVVQMMLRQGFVPVGTGLIVGLALGFGVNQALAKQLSGFVTIEPLLVIAVAALLAVVGVLACFVPARRAARVDPLVALRYE